MTFYASAEAVCLTVVICGSVYTVLCTITSVMFRFQLDAAARRRAQTGPGGQTLGVSILKPLYGADKELLDNLRAACSQDYPEFQVVMAAQRLNDPAIPAMRQVEQEFGPACATLAIAESEARTNGKIQNLEIALPHARHEVLVISDSDVKLRPDYLQAVMAPLADPDVGLVCTPYRAINAAHWFEKLELLTMNADFVPNLIFASLARLVTFGLGASMCFRRADLDAIGGFAAFRDHLAEDSHMAARIAARGKRVVLAPYFVDMQVDLKSFAQWWSHQLYWDQNTRAIRPVGFFATLIVRALPFALLFAMLRGFDRTGVEVLIAVAALRLASAAYILGGVLEDREGLASLWLLPLRDVLGLVVWFFALVKRDYIHRGKRFSLLSDGRIVPRPAR